MKESKKQELKKQIETQRQSLLRLAEIHGLSSVQVLEVSRKLDLLIHQYQLLTQAASISTSFRYVYTECKSPPSLGSHCLL
ncbi:MAG: Spo0E family sporulation regulatory protein-aspartic acid phosphatase [Ectobacillus sp.]